MAIFLDRLIIAAAILLFGVLASANASTGIDTTSESVFSATDGALILERANSNENIYSSATGEFISYLRGNVSFRFEDLRISADSAIWRRNDGIVDFTSRVRVNHKGQLMMCDNLHFIRDSSVLTASGNVFYRDSARITFIRGETAEYMTDIKEATLRGNPLLTRIDSTDSEIDTIFLRGRIVTYSDSLKIATVTDNVSITRGSLVATGQIGQFFSDDNKAILRIDPVILYEGHKVVGDSIDLFLSKESLESAVVVGNTHVYYEEIADSTSDTTITNIWSDSLHLSMFDSGKINTMKAIGNARGDYSEVKSASNSVTTTNFSSDSMHIFMFETGKIRVMKAYGGAQGDYSENNASSNSITSTTFSSDSMHIFMFESGKINTIKAFGNARGNYNETTMGEAVEISAQIPADTSTRIPIDTSAQTSTARARSAVSTDILSDSLHMFMLETGKIRAIRAFGNAHGRSAEWSLTSQAQDSSITHIWSDSLRVAMTDAGKIRTMRAFGGDSADVRSLNFTVGDSARANEITGRRMTILFAPNGKIDRAVVTGDAKSLYHLEEADGGGQNKASGDRIVVTFTAGKAQRIRVWGNVKGYYAP